METRVCACGCGRELRDENGKPIFNRYFFSVECRNRDKSRRVLAKRTDQKEKKSLRDARARARLAPRPVWVTVRGRRIGLATAKGALMLAKRFPEILDQVGVEPVKGKKGRK